MDQLICVIDATTLVENIQEIKRLVNQGQIRLVVPHCTATALERKYANLKEEVNKKPLRQVEPQRPRTSAKQAKIEYPAFDINPLVAGEFLVRVRSNEQSSVEFQRDNEEYSPWKIMEAEEENRSATENRPATFAQAVQKQNIERLLSSDGAGNGLVKPRLVARTTGSDGSPWKKSNKALSLPISEVPKDARPILSCLLWRLHEKGATRWDTDRTIFLCNNEEMTSLAKRLGISTRSISEVRDYCDKRRMVDMRETSGNLEEHFGIQEKARATESGVGVGKPREAAKSPARFEPLEDNTQEKYVAHQEKVEAPRSPTTHSSASRGTAKSSGSEEKSVDAEKSEDQRASKVTDDSKLSEEKLEVALEAILSSGEKRSVPGLLVTNTDQKKPTATLAASHQAPAQPAHSHSNTLDPEKEHSIAAWVRSLMSNGDLSGRNSPFSGSSIIEPVAPEIEPVQDFRPLTYRQAVTGKTDEAVKKQAPPPAPKRMLSSPRVSPVRNPSSPKTETEDPADTDEDVVVFNPKAKRLSAQKAQKAQQPEQTQQSQNQQAQQTQHIQHIQQPQPVQQAQQTQQNLQSQTPKTSPRVNHTRNVSGGRPQSRGTNQRNARPGPPPVIIDPDSFGRDLLSNPQPNVARTFSPYGAHGRITNHHRGNYRAHNPRSHVHITPPRTNGAALVNGLGNANVQQAAEQQTNPSEPATTVIQPNNQTPPAASAAVVTPPTVSQPSPMTNGSSRGPPTSAPSAPSLLVNGSPNVNIRPDRPRYSPRGSPRHTPATSEGEIPFVLRSGQPRDVTRGKGKLWIP
ncbi:MAG: hypothetical protein LQ337_006098 [Flavoplaca oasis]|nr:MAG: hypothetical protein LQ337_006098 [Flavoplaca oasis]